MRLSRMRALLFALLLLAPIFGGAAAQTPQAQPAAGAPDCTLPSADIAPARPPPVGPAPVGPAPATPSMQGGAGLVSCVAWTDGCITCRRSEGAIVCNNTGIGCQPQAPRCLERQR